MEKTTRRSLFKSLVLTNRSTGPGPVNYLVNVVNGFDFSYFVHFLIFFILPLTFSVENPNFFMTNAKKILTFGQNLTIYLSVCLYDAYDIKFMQSEGIFIKNSLTNHYIIKKSP